MASRAYTTRPTSGSCLLLVNLDPKESALASASGQVEQRCWAPGHRAEMLGSSSTTRCHPSASSWPRSNPPSYRHPASGLASSNRRRPWRIHSHGARARWRGEPTPRSGRHTRPVACGMAFAPPESCRANGPSFTCCAMIPEAETGRRGSNCWILHDDPPILELESPPRCQPGHR